MDHAQGLSTQITYTCMYKLCPIEPLIMHRLRGRGRISRKSVWSQNCLQYLYDYHIVLLTSVYPSAFISFIKKSGRGEKIHFLKIYSK